MSRIVSDTGCRRSRERRAGDLARAALQQAPSLNPMNGFPRDRAAMSACAKPRAGWFSFLHRAPVA